MFKVRLFDIDFGSEHAILNLADANDMGVRARDRVKISFDGKSKIGIVDTTESFVKEGEIAVFSHFTVDLKLKEGTEVSVEPVEKPESVEYIVNKLHGQTLKKEEIDQIVKDIVDNKLTLIDMTAFVSALDVHGMDNNEIEFLTKSMKEHGKSINFGESVYDKHSLGGVPGDKTTLLVTPIIAAAGLTIPKTSSRSITDPAGTADRMEIFAPVSHGIKDIIRIVEKTNGCIVWGGAVDLSPADDALIHIEHPLSLDPRPLLLASVMSKKYAVGSKFVVIDIPVGGTKVDNIEEAQLLAKDFIELGKRIGMRVECAVTYGAQPVGNAMGPVLEAIEALETFQGDGPASLVEKATSVAGIILEASNVANKGEGDKMADKMLMDGTALKKFREIIKAQGGNPDVTVEDLKKQIGKFKFTVKAKDDGYVTKINNRDIASVAKIAGAPHDRGAGAILHAKGGDMVKAGKDLFTIYAEKEYKLENAKNYAMKTNPVTLEGMLIEEIPGTVLGRHS